MNADESFAEGVRLIRAGQLAEAEVVLKTAVGQFELLLPGIDAGAWSPTVQRRAALACWRHSAVLSATGRPEEALPSGRRGIELGRLLLDRLRRTAPEYDEVTAETVTALVDLAEAAFAAGLPDERFALLGRAITLCADNQHPTVRRALGSALHNQANAMLQALVDDVMRGGQLRFTIETIDVIAAHTVAIRTDIARLDLLASWELANSLLLHGRVQLLGQQPRPAIKSLTRAVALIGQLGPGAGGLLPQARELATALEQSWPREVRQARRRRSWPF